MRSWLSAALLGCASILLMVVVYLLRGFVVYLMWNWMIPDLTGWAEITFWQSVGLVLLISNLVAPISNINLKEKRQ